ncbi:response regulator transcription factor [Salipaludibacillus neizhouensis]|nr:helix-turn-helix domain-containing protein [Salipaludibacillus neizhouensis]
MNRVKAVICEDEARIRRGIVRLIDGFDGWEVVGAFPDGEPLLEEIEDKKIEFDVLITDIKMPNMGGIELIKKLNHTHSILSVIISGFEDFEIVQEALREGAIDYILKPIDRKMLEKQFRIVREKVIDKIELDRHLVEVHSEAKELTYTKQVQLLSEMVLKNDIDLSNMEWTRKFPAGKYMLINTSLDNLSYKKNIFSDKDWETWIFAIENIIDETLESFSKREENNVWWWRGEKSSYWFLLHFDEEDINYEDQSKGVVKHVKKNIQTYTPLTFSFALEDYFNDLSVLPAMRDKILSLMQLRMIHGGNRVYYPAFLSEIHKESKGKTSQKIYLEIQKLVLSIEKLDVQDVERKFPDFFSELKKLESPEAVETTIRFYLFRVIKYLFKDDNRGYEYLYPIFIRIKNISDFEQLKFEVITWTKNVINEKMSVDSSLNHIDKAKYWIQQNVSESITISKIADIIYMNPTYFCEVFKKQTGETVLDYVTRIRIEKAKDLLHQSNLKIHEISEEVGFKDTKYFSKLFKQYTGELPSKYRNIQL